MPEKPIILWAESHLLSSKKATWHYFKKRQIATNRQTFEELFLHSTKKHLETRTSKKEEEKPSCWGALQRTEGFQVSRRSFLPYRQKQIKTAASQWALQRLKNLERSTWCYNLRWESFCHSVYLQWFSIAGLFHSTHLHLSCSCKVEAAILSIKLPFIFLFPVGRTSWLTQRHLCSALGWIIGAIKKIYWLYRNLYIGGGVGGGHLTISSKMHFHCKLLPFKPWDVP